MTPTSRGSIDASIRLHRFYLPQEVHNHLAKSQVIESLLLIFRPPLLISLARRRVFGVPGVQELTKDVYALR